MRENLRPGELFPDIELANEDAKPTKLSSLMHRFPTVVVFSRGYYLLTEGCSPVGEHLQNLQRLVVCGPSDGRGAADGLAHADVAADRLVVRRHDSAIRKAIEVMNRRGSDSFRSVRIQAT